MTLFLFKIFYRLLNEIIHLQLNHSYSFNEHCYLNLKCNYLQIELSL